PNACHSERSEESAFSPLSATLDLADFPAPAEFTLFNERGARAVVSVKPTLLARVLETTRQYGVAAHSIGQVIRSDGFRIQVKGRAVIDSPLEFLRDAWANSLERTLAAK